MTLASKLRPLALIREAECIGCTKCIQACPVDAIVGSAKKMHTVIADECIGCELCLPPCPVDCIELIPAPVIHNSPEQRRARALVAKTRVQARKKRLESKTQPPQALSSPPNIDSKKHYVEAALLRAKAARKIGPQ